MAEDGVKDTNRNDVFEVSIDLEHALWRKSDDRYDAMGSRSERYYGNDSRRSDLNYGISPVDRAINFIAIDRSGHDDPVLEAISHEGERLAFQVIEQIAGIIGLAEAFSKECYSDASTLDELIDLLEEGEITDPDLTAYLAFLSEIQDDFVALTVLPAEESVQQSSEIDKLREDLLSELANVHTLIDRPIGLKNYARKEVSRIEDAEYLTFKFSENDVFFAEAVEEILMDGGDLSVLSGEIMSAWTEYLAEGWSGDRLKALSRFGQFQGGLEKKDLNTFEGADILDDAVSTAVNERARESYSSYYISSDGYLSISEGLDGDWAADHYALDLIDQLATAFTQHCPKLGKRLADWQRAAQLALNNAEHSALVDKESERPDPLGELVHAIKSGGEYALFEKVDVKGLTVRDREKVLSDLADMTEKPYRAAALVRGIAMLAIHEQVPGSPELGLLSKQLLEGVLAANRVEFLKDIDSANESVSIEQVFLVTLAQNNAFDTLNAYCRQFPVTPMALKALTMSISGRMGDRYDIYADTMAEGLVDLSSRQGTQGDLFNSGLGEDHLSLEAADLLHFALVATGERPALAEGLLEALPDKVVQHYLHHMDPERVFEYTLLGDWTNSELSDLSFFRESMIEKLMDAGQQSALWEAVGCFRSYLSEEAPQANALWQWSQAEALISEIYEDVWYTDDRNERFAAYVDDLEAQLIAYEQTPIYEAAEENETDNPSVFVL